MTLRYDSFLTPFASPSLGKIDVSGLEDAGKMMEQRAQYDTNRQDRLAKEARDYALEQSSTEGKNRYYDAQAETHRMAMEQAKNNDMEAFAKWAGIQLTHLPNKGGGAAITNDLVTGDAHVALVNAASSGGVIKGGQVRALAVMSDARLPEYPDVPTLKELGYSTGKGLWSALYAPAATPREALETLHRATVQALNSEPVQTAFKKQMIKSVPNASIAEAQEWNKAETAYWRRLTEEVKVELPD